MRITNRGDKRVVLNLQHALRGTLKTADGKELPDNWIAKTNSRPAPMILKPGEGMTAFLNARLEWNKDGKTLDLLGNDRASGAAYEPIADYQFGNGRTDGHPVFLRNHLLIRDDVSLRSYGLNEP